jgi:hypothetical protein
MLTQYWRPAALRRSRSSDLDDSRDLASVLGLSLVKSNRRGSWLYTQWADASNPRRASTLDMKECLRDYSARYKNTPVGVSGKEGLAGGKNNAQEV